MKEPKSLSVRCGAAVRVQRLVRHLWQSHCFFVRESRSYAGGWNPRFPTQYPKAWVRFMWFSLRDYMKMPNDRTLATQPAPQMPE